ncbi:MAG: AraC family transcriptional regulator [Bacteroidales bacterium]|nr:AraC family transcriptional regulator [Bacteroidales bacterium]
MSYFFVIGIFEAISLFVLIEQKKNKNLADKILGGVFLLFGLNILLAFIEYHNRQNGYPFPAFIQTTPSVILLQGPMLWFYVKAQTEQDFHFKPVHLLHFLPFVIMQVHFSFSIYFLPQDVKIQMDATEGFKKMPIYTPMMMMILISPPLYYVWALTILRKYTRRIKNYFSKIEHIYLHWLRVLLISSLMMTIIINITFFVDHFVHLAPFGFLQAASFVFVSIYVLFLGFFGHRQEGIYTKVLLQQVDKPLGPETSINKADEDFIYRLLSIMKEKKPYLNPDLTLSALSTEMGVTEEFLSGILNGQLNRNFFDFVNHYRVEDFKVQCLNPQNTNLTLIGIAYNCGFNSKATFNRVFKKMTNLTPGEFKQHVSIK